MTFTITLGTMSWIALGLFWVALLFWPHEEAGSGMYDGIGNAIDAAIRFVIGLLVTVIFLGAKIAFS